MRNGARGTPFVYLSSDSRRIGFTGTRIVFPSGDVTMSGGGCDVASVSRAIIDSFFRTEDCRCCTAQRE